MDRYLISHTNHNVINLDKLTYAANPQALKEVQSHPNYTFIHGDICDGELLEQIFDHHQPTWVIHLAAESHVDKSIYAAQDFIQTNIVGTFQLLQTALGFWHTLDAKHKHAFRFLHVSTDEVYGELTPTNPPFHEHSHYQPSSPYSASKASSDHLVSAWHRTYGLPIIISNCSNNYGPYQHPEKLIPKMIQLASQGNPLPIYGSGQQIRDWLHVNDHVKALLPLLNKGKIGDSYCVGGKCEKNNLEVVNIICQAFDQLNPFSAPHSQLIIHVADREGHDYRYAINTQKIEGLGWQPENVFEDALFNLIQPEQ